MNRLPLTDADVFTPVEPRWWVSNLGGMVVFGAVAGRSKSRLLRRGFALAVGLHVAEAVYAYGSARRAGYILSANRWALQTLAVGFPSLQALGAARADQALRAGNGGFADRQYPAATSTTPSSGSSAT